MEKQDQTPMGESTITKTSRLAVASLILAAFGIFLLQMGVGLVVMHPGTEGFKGIVLASPLFASLLVIPAGLVLGIIALVAIRRSHGKLQGTAFAVAGLLLTGFIVVSTFIGLMVMRKTSQPYSRHSCVSSPMHCCAEQIMSSDASAQEAP